MTNWATESAARIEERLLAEESVGLLNDLARERLLAHYHDRAGEGATWLADVVAPLERAISDFHRRSFHASISFERSCISATPRRSVRESGCWTTP